MKEELKHAYKMGEDCARNGTNEINCDFRIFSAPEKTKEWEKGRDNLNQTEKRT